ncbi:hypothetical protein [Natronoglycomyces albus]|uniref:DUF4352 domain-containing protein n=1 Tax=Natronoglycomyces albus TaxID=2811108 RepID=A0A895XIR3_9ACTN|nr:hypothetical protein [Natronoglycomyces albus]QSB05691.1 hypothetical protein JQS30_01825 [Natronoglycomyces albus]
MTVKTKTTPRRRAMRLAALASGVVLTAGLAACGGDDSSSSSDSGDNDNGSSDSSDNGEADGNDGSNPGSALPAGSTVEVGDWEVTLGDTVLDAAELVADENQFNDEAQEGHQFVLVAIDATYIGEDSGNFWIDVTMKVHGSGGNTFDDRCGVIPDDITDAGETFSGASVSGNLCVEVESDQLDGATWMVEELFSMDDNRFFIEIE